MIDKGTRPDQSSKPCNCKEELSIGSCSGPSEKSSLQDQTDGEQGIWLYQLKISVMSPDGIQSVWQMEADPDAQRGCCADHL